MMLSKFLFLLGCLASCQALVLNKNLQQYSLFPREALSSGKIIPTKFNMGDLKTCIGNIEPYWVSDDAGLYTLIAIRPELANVTDVDDVSLDCFQKYDFSGNVESLLLYHTDDLPENSTKLADMPDGTQPIAIEHIDNGVNVFAGGRPAQFRGVGYYVNTCDSAEHTLYLPEFTDCLNPVRSNSNFKAIFVQNFQCCAMYVKRYWHHDCRLRQANGSGGVSSPTVAILYANQNYCFT